MWLMSCDCVIGPDAMSELFLLFGEPVRWRQSGRNVTTNAARSNAFFAFFGRKSHFFVFFVRGCTSSAAVLRYGTVRSTRLSMIEGLARLGYASIGIVYMIVGGFAVAAALGRRGSTGG